VLITGAALPVAEVLSLRFMAGSLIGLGCCGKS
jgi:hypothetical protein